MSSFLVGHTHIDALLTAAGFYHTPHRPLRWAVERDSTDRTTWGDNQPTIIGRMLVAANEHSVGVEPGMGAAHLYHYKPMPLPAAGPDPRAVLGALACYTYQSCDHSHWRISQARQFCLALHYAVVDRVLPTRNYFGEIRDRDIFVTGTEVSW